MLFVPKTLLLSPSPKKLSEYQTQFAPVFKGREPLFDELLAVIGTFYNAYQEFLDPNELLERLQAEGHTKLADYLSNLLTNPTVPIHSEESSFFLALEQEELDFTKQQAILTFRRAEAALAQPKVGGLAGIIPSIDTTLLELHQLKARMQRTETSTSSLLMGSENVGSGHSLPEIYQRIEQHHDTKAAVYFDLGVNKFADIRFKDGDLVIFGGFTSHGKALATTTLIPTLSGWTTMGKLQVGDVVFSDTGDQCHVTAVSAVMLNRNCFNVQFSDGSSIIADEDHQWFTQTDKDRVYRHNNKLALEGEGGLFEAFGIEVKTNLVVRTTREIKETLISERGQGRLNHSVQVNGALQCPRARLPMEPYLFGVWLGDGTSLAAQITIGEVDSPEMLFHLKKAIDNHGWRISKLKEVTSFGIIGGMLERLKEMGVLGKKHILPIYLRASIEQRLALFQGLMDTDGYTHPDRNGSCEFVTIKEDLAKSVVELIRTLGCKANITVADATLNGRLIGPKYRIIFSPEFPVFRLTRKAEVLAVGRAKCSLESRQRYIKAVEPITSVPVKCITVDSPSQLFLCGERLIPTHNSIVLRHFAYRQIYRYGRNVAFYSSEMSHDALRGLFALMHANNKVECPNTPIITYDAYKSGTLTAEEKDFLFHVADHDLRNNPKLGTLYIDQPNKSKFRLSDLSESLLALEATMPVHCLVMDYLTLMHPLETDRGHPERADYNNLIKGFKNLLITHRDIKGNIAPLLGITAHQLSRWGLEACLKADNRYEIAHFAEFSEIEKSADHLFTCLMTTNMKNTNTMRLQHLKNRDGMVVADPVDIFIDFNHGMKLFNTADRPQSELTAIFKILTTRV